MQTLRKRTSPCKYKNDPSKFTGEGITFKAKLIGILEVSEARGDKMCQDALNDLKTAIRAAGEHKQRITISISTEGLKLRDEKSGDCLYHHPVHKISFIAQDMSDSRAFGYIFGSPDTGHRFFGIKTDKTASQVVIAMRDLFQVVFELKKKEIEMAKHQSEMVHHPKCPGSAYLDSILFSRFQDDSEADKGGKGKYSQLLKSRCQPPKYGEATTSDFKGSATEAIADLLDLEHELNSIQQGINQMEKITPSDPFGPLSKGEPYVDPFDDSFPPKAELPAEEKQASTLRSQSHSEEPGDHDRHSFFGSTASSSKSHFFSQFSPGIGKSKMEESKWFDQETESLFSETVNVSNAEPTSSPIALSTPVPEPDQTDGKKSPIKTDLFTELDPLGTGRVKPYVDKKDFFQELKNPPKKVLKEMITDSTVSDVPPYYFPAQFKDDKLPSDTVHSSITLDSLQGFKEGTCSKYSRIDPFDDGDPFEKTDPFQDETFPAAVGFPPLFGPKSSMEGIFDDKMSWQLEKPKESKEDKPIKSSPTNISLFSSNTLRVSLPPEKSDASTAVPLSISTITSKLKSSPNSPEDPKNIRRKCYQSLKQSTVEGSEDSPVHEEPFVSTKVGNFGTKIESDRKSPFKEKFYSVQSPPSNKGEKQPAKMYSSAEILDATTPDPPPRAKTTIFSIKPPPLPPKKQNQPAFKPPARPPSLEDGSSHYDYLEKKDTSCNGVQITEELKCVKLRKQLFTGKDSPPVCEVRKQNSDTNFPVLLPPPNRKTSTDAGKVISARKTEDKPKSSTGPPGSILNLKLNQLDNTGLENLAITLGIPSENIYSMTLQELTKMLAEKYLNTTENKSESATETFEADFDANFGKSETKSDPPPCYDKYAVFKELIENESKVSESLPNANNVESDKVEEEDVGMEKEKVAECNTQEDKYAALRQLSLNPQKSDNFSEDEEIGEKADIRDVTEPLEETQSTAINNLDLEANLEEPKTKWSLHFTDNKSENAEGSTEKSPLTPKTGSAKDSEEKTPKDTHFPSDSQLFPLVDQFSDGKKPNSPRDNWATFEKSDFEGPTRKKTDNFNENENSPFSSDGKEEVPFHWHQKTFRKRTRKDVPWKDDDESWDDYSPKESFCSDESSNEDRSPEAGKEDRYQQSWKSCGRLKKSERTWNEQSGQWSRRNKWQEETEDEFEGSWRKQRERTGSYDTERQSSFWHNNYDGYNKRYDWCNSRKEPWNENERHLLCYGTRRKRSESDNEYRKRCDSDASDKECVWTFQKRHPDNHGRSGKQKPYYASGHPSRTCPDRFHESRTKHRKGVSQKRPSSASEPKRTYEMLSSPADYPFRSSEKNFPAQRDPENEEYSRYGYSRHRTELNFPLYYSSFDRKHSPHKMYSQRNRGAVSGQSEGFPPPNEKGEAMVEKNPDFDFFEPYSEKNYKYGKSETRFSFDVDGENFERTKKSGPEPSPQDFPKSPDRRLNHWASANGKTNGDGFCSSRNNNDSFAAFQEDAKTSPKKNADNPLVPEGGKPQPKNKNHLAMLSRQDSSATLRKSDSINIFSRDKDPFEGDDFFSSVS